jgi:hypothetical protein
VEGCGKDDGNLVKTRKNLILISFVGFIKTLAERAKFPLWISNNHFLRRPVPVRMLSKQKFGKQFGDAQL